MALMFFFLPLTSFAETPVDKVCCCLEVGTYVKVNGVVSFYAHVGDPHAIIDIWLSSVFTVSCIQDVSDSMLREISSVFRTVSEKQKALYSIWVKYIL